MDHQDLHDSLQVNDTFPPFRQQGSRDTGLRHVSTMTIPSEEMLGMTEQRSNLIWEQPRWWLAVGGK